MQQLLSLRRVVDGDRALLQEIFAAARRAEFSGLGWPQAQLELFLAQQFAAQDRHYRAYFRDAEQFIVCCGDADAGRLYLHRDRDEIRIVDISLLPEYRGGGIGTRLIEQLQADAERRNLSLCLSVAPHNPAMNLYRRLGFLPTAEDGAYVSMEWRPHAAASPG